MHRLFVAIVPPPHIRDRLLASMSGVAGARWQADDQLHLTLRFIGDADRHLTADIAAALGSVRSPPFELTLGAPGGFDRRGRMDTLWVGVAPAAPVAALAKSVNEALRAAGMPPEHRAFLPHITVARLGRTFRDAEGYFAAAPSGGAGFAVTGFTLFESIPGSGGSQYLPIENYSLIPAVG